MSFLLFALEMLWWVIVVDAVLSWIQRPHEAPRKFIVQLTDPLYAPFRALISPEKTGGIDLSPLALLLLIRLARTMIAGQMF
jgi:YggT family protein